MRKLGGELFRLVHMPAELIVAPVMVAPFEGAAAAMLPDGKNDDDYIRRPIIFD